MDQLLAMRAMLRVVDTGSFSAAARQLGIGQPAVSRAVAQIEAKLGVRLRLVLLRPLVHLVSLEPLLMLGFKRFVRRLLEENG